MSDATISHPVVQTALAQHRISRLASMLPVHQAFRWLHLHQLQLRQWQMEILAIPAPPFAEQQRAAWFIERFRSLGLVNVHLDDEGNAVGEFGGREGADPGAKFLLLSAHLDTVFPANTPCAPVEDGPRILCPGACDNAAGLTALLGIVAALRSAAIESAHPILFVANVGEEGEGDLRGMRYLFERGPYRDRIAAAIALEGSGTAVAVTRALGSRRYRISITGPGGHSWSDAGRPNPILLLARGLLALEELDLTAHPDGARTTLSAGQIGGGTSVNSIPAAAWVTLDLRSTDPVALASLAQEVEHAFSDLVRLHNSSSEARDQVRIAIDGIGDRPAASLPESSPLLHSLRAVDRHLGLRSEFRLGSTDANLPLSLGVPALALAAGGTGGGIHTVEEWYDPTGRESALRRILLLTLDMAQTLV
jgi:tripeptide aminopeptidase